MERTTPDARALVDQLRLKAKARSRPWQPDPLPGPPHRVPMTAHPGLKHLHEHWALPDRFDAPGGRGGPRWKQLVWRVAGKVTGGVMHDYVAAERELIANMVRYCDAMAKRVDALERDIDTLAQAGSRQAAELATHLVPQAAAPGTGAAFEDVPSPEPAGPDPAGRANTAATGQADAAATGQAGSSPGSPGTSGGSGTRQGAGPSR